MNRCGSVFYGYLTATEFLHTLFYPARFHRLEKEVLFYKIKASFFPFTRNNSLSAGFHSQDIVIVATVAGLSLGVMVLLTRLLIRQQERKRFILSTWIGYLLITLIGSITVLYAIQRERNHWERFFLSSVVFFGVLAQTEGHSQIEFSFSLWTDPLHSHGIPFEKKALQPDLALSNRKLATPKGFKVESVHEKCKIFWEPVSEATGYEVEWYPPEEMFGEKKPDGSEIKEGWQSVHRGTETEFIFDSAGWFRVCAIWATPPDDPVFKRIHDILETLTNDTPDVGYVYTMRDYDAENYVIILDIQNENFNDVTKSPAYIGERYSKTNFTVSPPETAKPVIDYVVVEDEWGKWFSSARSLFRPDGKVDGFVGVDYPADAWKRNILQTQVNFTFFQIFTYGIFFYGVALILQLHRRMAEQKETLSSLNAVNKALMEAKQGAETAARSKSYFLANMSHEIRTPMNAVLGFADILGRRLISICGQEQREDNQQTIDLMERSANDLLTIIGDILDFSKVDAGLLEVESVPTNPRAIVNDVSSLLQPKLEAKPDVQFQTAVGDNVPDWVFCDPTRLRQILCNICGNAIKFSERGSVLFKCQHLVLEDTDTTRNEIRKNYGNIDFSRIIQSEPKQKIALLQFIVRDDGIGIPLDQKSKLFLPFTQADTSTTRRFGGTGLGLSTAKRLTELLGGDITVVSEEGYGSTFTLTLPVTVVSYEAERNNSYSGIVLLNDYEKPLFGLRVLVVDDGKVNQIVMTKQLEDSGAAVSIAENGKIALDLVIANPSSYDIILMDMQMPVMDGYEATFRLRQRGYKQPIIAVTAHALTGDCEKTLKVGCNGYITKPVDRHKLIDMILRFDQASFSVQ
ncbi:hypothetical protein FACS189419_04650 [Planctomycetales bacterium]|nr:hypothetical protein FACS189419_04650 [Planctomycetales bacterium]